MIEVRDLTKTFRGRKGLEIEAVRQITFQCRPGEVYGLVGPNGAGKTTTLRMIATALQPTAGHGSVAGFDLVAAPWEVRKHIGVLNANVGLYLRLTPREVMSFFAELHDMSRSETMQRIRELATSLELTDFLDRPCDRLSTGMQQRVNVARSILHNPSVMLLDEPTLGLDLMSKRTIVQFIKTWREEGRTILLATHDAKQVETLCDSIGIFDHGRIAFQGTIQCLRESHGDDVEDALFHVLRGVDGK